MATKKSTDSSNPLVAGDAHRYRQIQARKLLREMGYVPVYPGNPNGEWRKAESDEETPGRS